MRDIPVSSGGTLPVFMQRTIPIDADSYPLMCVYAPRDVVTVLAGRTPGNRFLRREITVRLMIYFGRPEQVENSLEADADAILLQVENRMSTGFSLSGASGQSVALKATLGSIESAPVDAGSTTLVVLAASYAVTVDHHERDAGVALSQIQQRH